MSILGQVQSPSVAEHQQLQPDTSSSSGAVLDICRDYTMSVGLQKAKYNHRSRLQVTIY